MHNRSNTKIAALFCSFMMKSQNFHLTSYVYGSCSISAKLYNLKHYSYVKAIFKGVFFLHVYYLILTYIAYYSTPVRIVANANNCQIVEHSFEL